MFDITKLNIFRLNQKGAAYQINAQWSPEMAQEVAAFHNIDAEAELAAILSEQLAGEINYSILNSIRTLPSSPIGLPGPQGISPPMGEIFYLDYVPLIPLQVTPHNVNSEAAMIDLLHTSTFFNKHKLKPFKLIEKKGLMKNMRDSIIRHWESLGLTNNTNFFEDVDRLTAYNQPDHLY